MTTQGQNDNQDQKKGGFLQGEHLLVQNTPLTQGGCCGTTTESSAGCCGEPSSLAAHSTETTPSQGCCGEPASVTAPTRASSQRCC